MTTGYDEIQNKTKIISTGSTEIDKKLGGGIPVGSLVLLEGQSDAGKSVVSQHFCHGFLNSKMSTAYYTTENTVKSLMTQMSSLNLDVTDFFLCNRMRVYPVDISAVRDDDTEGAFQLLLDHIDCLPNRFQLVIVDSLTGLVTHSEDRAVIDFFAACTQLCQYYIDTFLIDDTHTLSRDTQTYETVFAFNPEAVALQVRQKATLGFDL